MKVNKRVLLCVLDGFGEGVDYEGNAITRAKAPFIRKLKEEYPTALLDSSGRAVGIPAGTQGGSEVGHFTMGAGRIVNQSLEDISQSIDNGSFFEMPDLIKAAEYAKKTGCAFHILGMISDQGVHSDIKHAFALLDFAKRQGLEKVYLHGIADGRDVPEKSLPGFLDQIDEAILKYGVGKLASLIGRYYAMDRDENFERTEKAFNLYVNGEGAGSDNAKKAVNDAYEAGLESDYYLEPILLDSGGLVKENDVLVFFNFRTDRAKQLTDMFLNKMKLHFIAMGPYTKKAPVLFPAIEVKNNLGSVLEENGLKQLRIAETEKYAHVTFFFNSQVKEPFQGETRKMIDSPKVASYADKPEMSAHEITDELIPELKKDYSFVLLNFANLDLVGHSGDFEATKKAVETIDDCLSRIVPEALKNGYDVLITGDHGNAEYMIYENGDQCPSHTKNPVPFIFVSEPVGKLKCDDPHKICGGLQDIAPTVLQIMGLEKPKEMTGESLV